MEIEDTHFECLLFFLKNRSGGEILHLTCVVNAHIRQVDILVVENLENLENLEKFPNLNGQWLTANS